MFSLEPPTSRSLAKHNYAYVKKPQATAEFTISDVSRSIYATRHELTQKKLRNCLQKCTLREFTNNPLLTLRCYKSEMEACLKYGNADAHFVEGVKQYFALNQPVKGLKHLKISSKKNHELGNYLYAILLLITKEHEKGMAYMDLHNWRNNMMAVNICWIRLKRCLRNVPILKRKSYRTNMLLIMPPRRCILQEVKKMCNDCFYYKQMKKFLDMIISP